MKTLNATVNDIAAAARDVENLEVMLFEGIIKPCEIQPCQKQTEKLTLNAAPARFQVSQDGLGVRRVTPIPAEDVALSRTIYAKPFKIDSVGKVCIQNTLHSY